MKHSALIKSFVLLSVLVVVASSCSIFKRKTPDYTASGSLPPLEVPPDLVLPDNDPRMMIPGTRVSAVATAHNKPGKRSGATHDLAYAQAPQYDALQIRRDGSLLWLVLHQQPQNLWSQLRLFWRRQGFQLAEDDPSTGVMETKWTQSRTSLPPETVCKLRKAGILDKYKLHLEHAGPGVLNAYITHRGAEVTGADCDNLVWQPRRSNLELEAQMLGRLMTFLGDENRSIYRMVASTGDQRKATLAAQTMTYLEEKAGQPVLRVTQRSSQAWRNTARALHSTGFKIREQEPAQKTFEIAYFGKKKQKKKKQAHNESSDVAKLASNNPDIPKLGIGGWRIRYQVRLKDQGPETLITAAEKDGDKLSAEVSRAILQEIQRGYPDSVIGGQTQVATASQRQGVQQVAAQPVTRVSTRMSEVKGNPTLTIDDQSTNVWRNTSLALQKAGFKVREQDRDKAHYTVVYYGYKKGKIMIENYAIPKLDNQMLRIKYRVSVKKNGAHTDVTAWNKKGKPLEQQLAQTILEEIQKAYPGAVVDKGPVQASNMGDESATIPADSEMTTPLQTAPKTVETHLETIEGEPVLTITDTYDHVWTSTALALQRAGFTVREQDSNKGLYYAIYERPPTAEEPPSSEEETHRIQGWTRYQIRIVNQGDRTQITARNRQGDPLESETSKAILTEIRMVYPGTV